MDIRELDPEETASVRDIARRSLEASYSGILSQETITNAVEEWYSEAAFADYLDSDEMVFLVADDGGIVGFSQSHILEDINKGRILWLHVDPDHRGRGIAKTLFERTRAYLTDRGTDRVTGLVLADHEAGNQFYASRGFEVLYDRAVTIGGEEYTEHVYGDPGVEPSELELWVTPGGEEVFVDFEDSTRGSEGPFDVVYRSPDRTRRYGWFCSVCESIDNAMDSMGRIECNQCGNRRKATRWDAGYL